MCGVSAYSHQEISKKIAPVLENREINIPADLLCDKGWDTDNTKEQYTCRHEADMKVTQLEPQGQTTKETQR